jgi:hypothetical protein
MKAPERLLDDRRVSDELRADLSQMADTRASYDVAYGLAALQRSLDQLPAAADAADAAGGADVPSLASSASAGAGVASGVSLAIKAALVAALGAAAFFGASLRSERAPAPPVSSTVPSAAPAAPAHNLEAQAQLPVTPRAAASAAPSARPSRAADVTADSTDRSLAAERGDERRAAQASRREIRLMVRIKASIERDPAAAHRMILAANRQFPDGVLQEERDGLDAIALFELGETARAKAQAERFLQRYPHSALRPRLERYLTASYP